MKQRKKKTKRTVTDEMIQEYCIWMQRCEKSKATIRKYRCYLLKFKDYAGGNPICANMVADWKLSLRRNLAPVTVNGALAAVNGFCKFAKWTDCKARFFKISKDTFFPESRELSREEYIRLVQTAMKHKKEWLALLIQTVCACGIRISELAFITVEAAWKGQAEVECKGSIRTVLLTRQLCAMLLDYAGRHGVTSGMIFITRNGKPLDRSNVWREMKRLGEEAGVDQEKIFPHNLRHLFARTYYALERNLSKLADILGHRNIETTRIYTRESGSKHREQLEKMQLLLGSYNGMSLLL